MVHQYVASGVPFLRSLNVKPFRVEAEGMRFIGTAFHQRLRKSALRPGDVVVVRSGNVGVAAVIPDSLPNANCSDLVVVRPGRALASRFAAVFINSAAARAHIEDVKVGIAQGHFNVGAMRRTPVPLPPVAEQHEIVRRVDELFGAAASIEERLATAASRAERLPQAVLGKAFRGELGSAPEQAGMRTKAANPAHSGRE